MATKPPTKATKAPTRPPTKAAAAKRGPSRPAKLAEIAETYETPIAEVNALYDEMLASEKETHPTLGEEQLQGRAVRRVYLQMKRNSGFGSLEVEGVILGSSDSINMNGGRIRQAKELFAKSPQLAMNKGVTDAQGTPLDDRKAFPDGTPNPNFGKPLTEAKYRYITFGVYTFPGQDTPVPMTMFVDGKLPVPPLMQRIKFKASFIKQSDREGENGIINVSENVTFQVIGPANIKAVCDKFLEAYSSDIANLGEYVAMTGPKNTVIVEGDVTQMYLEPEEGRSRSLRVDDDSSLGSRDVQGAAVWLPEHLIIDFAEDSRVIIVGSAKVSDKGVSIQAQGVYALPEYKIPLPQEGLDAFTEEELEGEEETEEAEEEAAEESVEEEATEEEAEDHFG